MKTVRQILGSAGASPAVVRLARHDSTVCKTHRRSAVVGFLRGAKNAGEAPALPIIIA